MPQLAAPSALLGASQEAARPRPVDDLRDDPLPLAEFLREHPNRMPSFAVNIAVQLRTLELQVKGG
jgi:hypothetical protein